MAIRSVRSFSSCKSVCWLLFSIAILNSAIIHKRIIKQRRLQSTKIAYLHDISDLHGFEPTNDFGLSRVEGHGPKLRSKYNRSRIAYCAGKGTQTFQLLKDASILLILSGDIECNPGPVKNPCSSCNRAVAKLIEHYCVAAVMRNVILALNVGMFPLLSIKPTRKPSTILGNAPLVF